MMKAKFWFFFSLSSSERPLVFTPGTCRSPPYFLDHLLVNKPNTKSYYKKNSTFTFEILLGITNKELENTSNFLNKRMPSSCCKISEMRSAVAGPDELVVPYPIYLKGLVTKGFGRGSKELGIPTGMFGWEARRGNLLANHLTWDERIANLPECVAQEAGEKIESGIYYGWASVGSSSQVWPMVMSFGWNPFYKNERRSAVFAFHISAATVFGLIWRIRIHIGSAYYSQVWKGFLWARAASGCHWVFETRTKLRIRRWVELQECNLKGTF